MAGYLGNIPTPQATQTRDTFTATASQTSFATSGYTVGMLDVYLNGIKLASADFTATNGSDVVLASGASADDIVEVVSFSTFETNSGVFTGDFSVDSPTFKVDSSNNRVGIGTASPSHPFHLITSTDGTGVSGDDTWAAVIQNAEATDGRSYGLKIMAGSTTDQAFAITDHDGSNDLMAVDGYGHITKPKQPAFLVGKSVAQTNIAEGGYVDVVFDSEIFDQNGDFSSNTFTAPVTGRYHLNATVRLQDLDVDAHFIYMDLVTSNRTYQSIITISSFDEDVEYHHLLVSVLADMDSGDTAIAKLYLHTGGDVQVDLGQAESFFSGYLAC